jgi:hypothetical protein
MIEDHTENEGNAPAPPATRCGCPDCLERVRQPEGYWDRVIARVVAETEPKAR